MGAAIAAGYRARGVRVVVNARTIWASDDPGVVAMAGDVGEAATGLRLVEAALDGLGRLDTVVNNAGLFIGGPFTAATEAEYRAILGTNLDGTSARRVVVSSSSSATSEATPSGVRAAIRAGGSAGYLANRLVRSMVTW